MTDGGNFGERKRLSLAFGILALLVFFAYSNTFQASWHLDDYPTVVENPRLHLSDLSPRAIFKTLFSRPGSFGNLYRPVACLSLALNWYFGQEQVEGYHFVNICIHFLAAFFLFLTILNLYQSPGLAGKDAGNGFWIALLAAALWALNPVQTQAVTYIVQRMASLAAMFYIIGLYLYVKGRTGGPRRRRLVFFAACLVSFIFALGSKENAAAFPAALILVEAVFFRGLDRFKNKKRIWGPTAIATVLLILVAVFLAAGAIEPSILKGYQNRSFTLSQRLMTQPRVVLFYLTLLFYPMPQRLSIEHDVAVSTSLFEPWTTFPAILSVALLIGIGLSQIKKRSVAAFGLLFFFLNHLIESTILPLELIFEHRNYLASMFLFFPVAAALVRLVGFYQARKSFIGKALIGFMVLLVTGMGISAYMRNLAWSSEKTLWEDAIRKAPARARPAYNLARYYAKNGHTNAALQLYQKALAGDASKTGYSRALSLNGIAGIYYLKGDYENVIKFCQMALAINPGLGAARHNQMLALAKLGRWEDVLKQIELLPDRQKNQPAYLRLKGEILLNSRQPAAALQYLRKVLPKAPGDPRTILNIGIALSAMRHYEQAQWFFEQARKKLPGDMRPYLYLIGAGLKAGNSDSTRRYLDELVASFNASALIRASQTCFDDVDLHPFTSELICAAVNAKIKELSDEIARLGES